MKDQKKGGGTKKHGRNKEKCAKYRAMHVGEKNKLKRVLQSSGEKEARRYASLYGLIGYLNTLSQ